MLLMIVALKAWKLARSNLLTCLLLFRWNSRGIHLGKSAGFHRVWERPQSHMCGEAGHYQTCFYHLAPRHQGNLLQQMGLVNDIYQSAFTYTTTTICFRQSTTLVQEAGYRWKPILLGTLQPLTSLSTQWLHPTRANTVAIRQMPKKLVWMFKYKKVRIPSFSPFDPKNSCKSKYLQDWFMWLFLDSLRRRPLKSTHSGVRFFP